MKKFNIKHFILGITFFTMGFFISACTTTSINAEQTHPLKIWGENRNGQMETWKVVDDETGVNYIVVAPKYNKGYEYTGIAITPRLNTDGSLYISE